MIHEHRVYHVMPDQLHQCGHLVLPIWDRLGIRQAGFWTILIGPSN